MFVNNELLVSSHIVIIGVTNNPELCHELLELILGRKVGAFTRLDQQKPIEITSDGKGIRFDVYSEDDPQNVYDCEMQTSSDRNLPKRTRYYQGMIDLNLIERGTDYEDLKKSYVIFVCPFDYFNHEEWRVEYMTLLMRDQEMMKKGREEGRLNEIFSSVQEGDYSAVRGAQKAGMSIDQFEKVMSESGYKIPTNA